MSKCSWWNGGHVWVIVGEGVKSVSWIRTHNGYKLLGTEYTKNEKTVIEKCSECQKLRAFDGDERRTVSIEFAKKKIISLNGFIEDGI